MIPFGHYIILGAAIFLLGLMGIFIARRNIISVLLAIEIMLIGVNINFIAFAAADPNIAGHIITLFVLCVAAAEMAIGLAILVAYYRLRANIEIDKATELKG